jgi:hypothetical protein
MPFNCEYCGFKVKSKGGLRQHIAGKPNCRAAEKKKAAITMKATMIPKIARPPSSPAASKPTGSSYFVMEKKLQKEVSIPTNSHGEMVFDDNFDNFDNDLSPIMDLMIESGNKFAIPHKVHPLKNNIKM